ncbi:DNA-binding LacI/PurR family transcriptional regulator [Actinopolyspora biskrensis]|uniref:DNA-binding LacI/PurR family transcriptional regulator n=1 Tax=Actinopolyspora biskrensis TaxID=1470178 RepID=A0A852YTL9_9ACTN|nr:substrate-binding domain-containing protein [Actinopolyspora biskrensis]NYH77440.1 DNA-binding LacI/PurR family transcriptional regulator [Actinopolyspora biskrensis]
MTLSAERQKLILSAVRQHGAVRISDLVERLEVTAVTVRRDVKELADRGLVARVHGGITLPQRPESNDQPGIDGNPVTGSTRTRTLAGMVTPSVEYYWPAVIKGAQATTASSSGRLVLRASSYDSTEDRRQVAKLLEHGVQVMLVAPTTTGNEGVELLRWLGSLRVPVVLLERLPPPELPALALDAVTSAHDVGAGLAMRHLITLGHRKLGILTSRSSPTSRMLRRGWREAIDSLGIPDTDDLEVEVPTYGSAGWGDAYDDVLRRCRRENTTGLLVHSDREAVGVVERARDLGIDVPGELAVLAYDDEIAAAADPPLTAIRPPKHRVGALAAELALTRTVENSDRPVHRVQLWPTLHVRETCGAAENTELPAR